MINDTYYQKNAERFFADTVNVDMSALYQPFIACLPRGACILDAGCGSGRDVKAFSEKGFEVEAFDASAKLVALARQFCAKPVQQMRFQDIDVVEKYDGIWCCASLLHVPAIELPEVLSTLAKALKPGGVWYLSFKYGSGEREKDGREFTDMDMAGLQTLIEAVNGSDHKSGSGNMQTKRDAAPKINMENNTVLETEKIWQTGDVRVGRDGELWLNAIIRKKILKI